MDNLRGAMKSYTLPALALVTLAAAAGAQTVPVKRANANELFSAGLTYSNSNSIANGGPDVDGYTLDVRASVSGNIFLTASYTDIEKLVEPGDFTASPSAYSLGLGSKFAVGNGSLGLSYAYRSLDFDVTVLTLDPVTLIDTVDQHWFRAAYTIDLGNGLDITLGLTHILNDTDSLDVDDVTAPEVSIGLKFGQGFSAQLSYSTEDVLFGLPDGDGTVSVGVRYGF